MLKDELKLGTCIRNKQTGLIYVITKRKRKSNSRSGWDAYTINRIGDMNMYSFVKYRIIKQYFTIDKTAQVLYSNKV